MFSPKKFFFCHQQLFSKKKTFFTQKKLCFFFLQKTTTTNFFSKKIVFIKKTQIVTELRNSNCENSATQLGQNSKTLILTEQTKKLNCNKTQNLFCDHNQIAIKLNFNSNKIQQVQI